MEKDMNNGQLQEPDAQEFSFITEKIKEKPINKKKLIVKFVTNLLMAVLFGAVACFTFYLLSPYVRPLFPAEETQKITFPSDEEPDVNNTQENAESEQESVEEENEKGNQEQIVNVVEKVGLELTDYQDLYSKLNQVADKAMLSMVTVTGVNSNVDWFNNPYESKGQASGLIIGNNGVEILILTEQKIIENVEAIQVTFQGGYTAAAAAKKYDRNTGMAILGIPLESLSKEALEKAAVAVLGNSYTLKPGTPVIAVGSPLGYNDSVTFGNITSTKNTATTMDVNYSLLTTDILGSSSGSGVLLNLNGEVIGVIAQDFSSDTENMTVTALAVSNIKGIIERLSNNLGIAYLGIKGADVTESISEELELPKGIYLTEVAMDSPAMAAGLQNGDVITKIGSTEIRSMKDLQNEMIQCEPEQLITVTASRFAVDEYKELTFDVTLGVLQ